MFETNRSALLCVALLFPLSSCEPEPEPCDCESEPELIEPTVGSWSFGGAIRLSEWDKCPVYANDQVAYDELFRVFTQPGLVIRDSATHGGVQIFTLDGIAPEFSNRATECHAYSNGEFRCYPKVFIGTPFGDGAMAIEQFGYLYDEDHGSLNIMLTIVDADETHLCSLWLDYEIKSEAGG